MASHSIPVSGERVAFTERFEANVLSERSGSKGNPQAVRCAGFCVSGDWDFPLAFWSTRPEIGEYFLWQKLPERETADRTFKMQSFDRIIDQAALAAFSALDLDFVHGLLRGPGWILRVQDVDHVCEDPDISCTIVQACACRRTFPLLIGTSARPGHGSSSSQYGHPVGAGDTGQRMESL